MDLKTFLSPAQMERNSFLWSEARLVVASVALFLGGVPPILLLPGGASFAGLLKLAWIISGVASGYLAYRWLSAKQRIFGGKNQTDLAAFAVSVLSGLNLGWTGLAGYNVGMSIVTNRFVFIVAGVLYLLAAAHLWKRWKAHGEKLY
jgi:hypothetical protein